MITVQSAANFNLYLTQNYLIQQEIRMFINRPCACVRACSCVFKKFNCNGFGRSKQLGSFNKGWRQEINKEIMDKKETEKREKE